MPLVGVMAAELIPEQKVAKWLWGAVHPCHRGKGLWNFMGDFVDSVTSHTGASVAYVRVPASHAVCRASFEHAGFSPISITPAVSESTHGAHPSSHHDIIWYGKTYHDDCGHGRCSEKLSSS